MVGTLNLCLDLNIWCAAFLADRKRKAGTAAQTLVGIARAGHVGIIPVQLIISWGMLTRLRKVFEIDWLISRPTVDPIIEAIAGYAGTGPYLTLGGTGLMPLRDQEDAHVLDTAIASQARLVVTANFDDFVMAKSRVLVPGQVAIAETATAKLVLAHPYPSLGWLRQGIFPDVETVERLLND
jgi:hypothetical protein